MKSKNRKKKQAEKSIHQQKNTADIAAEILPAKTISVFSKVVLGIRDSGTDYFCQLMFGDSPNTNWGVMSDTTYSLSHYYYINVFTFYISVHLAFTFYPIFLSYLTNGIFFPHPNFNYFPFSILYLTCCHTCVLCLSLHRVRGTRVNNTVVLSIVSLKYTVL